jgi:hypothetical protein
MPIEAENHIDAAVVKFVIFSFVSLLRKVGISVTTENGYTHQADLSGAGDLSYTFNIPENQGKSVQVCVKPGNLSIKNCRTYESTGSDMSESLPAVSSTSPVLARDVAISRRSTDCIANKEFFSL